MKFVLRGFRLVIIFYSLTLYQLPTASPCLFSASNWYQAHRFIMNWMTIPLPLPNASALPVSWRCPSIAPLQNAKSENSPPGRRAQLQLLMAQRAFHHLHVMRAHHPAPFQIKNRNTDRTCLGFLFRLKSPKRAAVRIFQVTGMQRRGRSGRFSPRGLQSGDLLLCSTPAQLWRHTPGRRSPGETAPTAAALPGRSTVSCWCSGRLSAFLLTVK